MYLRVSYKLSFQTVNKMVFRMQVPSTFFSKTFTNTGNFMMPFSLIIIYSALFFGERCCYMYIKIPTKTYGAKKHYYTSLV